MTKESAKSPKRPRSRRRRTSAAGWAKRPRGPRPVSLAPIPDPPEELGPTQVEFCRLYAGDPLLPSFGNIRQASRATGIDEHTGYLWAQLPAVQERIRQYERARDEDLEQLRERMPAAGILAFEKTIALLNRAESALDLDTPASYIAREKGIGPEDVVLPEEGTMEWGRIQDAVAKHNRNKIMFLREVMGQAKEIVTHAIGYPHRRVETTIRRDPDDNELTREIRRLTPEEQMKLLDFVKDAKDLLASGGRIERLEPVETGSRPSSKRRALPPD